MLSDHERKALRELERQFMADDPEFPRSFDARAQRLDRKHLGGSATIAIVVAVLLFALMLAAGSLGGALAFAAGTGLIWLAWQYSNDTRRQPP
ncbi:DUF3040 domain-containing protein (plasmid) [Pseudonocardia bannensis]|uniref:DUF3040 domain-containing protein n=1 Tax=Pseudonocardia bannensis TaxID=630973 RepID=A0A848DRT6_9PSEU|nr:MULTISPECIES: DUF3040 domain-containing protein [Pseudonocardia]NMH94974.1 DUF3040 domain-containing protein [Pseudonocardia bannensis]